MAADQMNSATKSSKDAAKDVAQGVKDDAKQARDRMMNEAKGMTGRTKNRVMSTVNQQKDRAADELGSVADAFRKTGEELRGQEHGQVAKYADRIAEQVDGLSGYLRNKDVGDFAHNLEDFARRQPALFIGGAVALGVVAARFLKSSSGSGNMSSRSRSGGSSSWDSGYGA